MAVRHLPINLRRQLAAGIASACFSASLLAAPLSLSDVPLFLSVPVSPNLVLTLDDSLSMPAASVPDSIGSDHSTNRFKSAYFNGLYYDPSIVYTPPPKYDGTTCTLDAGNPASCYPNVSYTAAPINGFDTTHGSKDLSSDYQATRTYYPEDSTQAFAGSPSGASDRSYYASSGAPTPVQYQYTCDVFFDNRSGSDRLDLSNCSRALPSAASGLPPASGSGSPASADGGTIDVSNAGATYSKSYTVSGMSSSSRILVPTSSLTADSAGYLPNVVLSWIESSSIATYPAYYYLFYTEIGAARPTNCTAAADSQKADDDCYIKVEVGSASDTAAGSTAQKQQNFANWYSYYRTRNLATVAGAMQAFAGADGNMRVAWQGLSSCNSFGTTCAGWDSANKDNRIRRLNAVLGNGKTHKQELYEWLSRFPTSGSTYLRSAAKRAGDYFMGSITISHPLADDPQIRDKPLNPDGTQRGYDACRRNIHLVMTDGGWCGETVTVGDTNSVTTTLPVAKPTSSDGSSTSTSWLPGAPYSDGQADNLADIAFKYWVTDLQSTLANNVPPTVKESSSDAVAQWVNPQNDPATWQHLNTYALGLGLGDTLVSPYAAWGGSTFAGDYAKLALGSSCPSSTTSTSAASPYCWPYTAATESCPPSSASQQRKVYDLWHAAIAGRGEFYSAESAADIGTAFRSIVNQVSSATASSASVAANSTSIQTGTLLYQARFDSRDWHGQLLALTVQGDGNVGPLQWDAAAKMPATGSRKIFTHNGSSGQAFSSCAVLSASQKAALDTNASGVADNKCSERLNWLRGDSSLESRFSGGIFRNRTVTVLGDIINSNPAFVYSEDLGYAGTTVAMPEKASYTSFVNSKSSRAPMVYVGANDGMLHGFRADVGNANSGRELFAYIPGTVYGNLSLLTDPIYSHRYFVDGAPMSGDAYLGGQWKTVLLGGLDGGGKSIYALDVSNPDGFAASNVLWEYADAADLGNTYSQPQIARLHDGHWAAVFGNGYNSASDRAYLYLVDLSNGALLAKIPAGAATSNGLSTPAIYDADGDKIADYVYAGDLQGNLWKFDITSAVPGNWVLANAGMPLFTARNAGNQVQPITVQPVIGGHPNGGQLVYFGTGRYLTSADPSNIDVQSFYAVWDSGTAGTLNRSQFQAQSITSETTEFGFSLRELSKNTVDWAGGRRGWYLDLVVPGSGGGERVVSNALMKHDRIIFSSMIPSTDPCVPGGISWLMELDTLTGGRTSSSVFDFNNDDKYDDSDKLASGNTASGVKSTVGITKSPTWLGSATSGSAVKLLSGTTGNIMSIKNSNPAAAGPAVLPVRTYWKQIL
jgi:type IV pilus assembly protein PilY1